MKHRVSHQEAFDRIELIADYTEKLNSYVLSEAKKWQSELPDLLTGPEPRCQLGPKFPARPFSYIDELNNLQGDEPVAESILYQEVASFFRGSIRPESPHSLFNMVPEPDIEATAAAWLVTAYNPNTLMDAFGGESLLVEQKVARFIGRWAGWQQSMGIACNGGKLTLLYALKSAIGRIEPDSNRNGVPRDVVILCSEGAHYCVEHAASLLGIGSAFCLRVPGTLEGTMDPVELNRILKEQHLTGKRIAAVICCGGTTINFSCEDTQKVTQVIDDFTTRYALSYRPYLHLDSVIGWLYLSILNADDDRMRILCTQHVIRKRLEEVQRRLKGLSGFDSLGVDFHKNGLCSYASSFFVARDRRFMDELGDGNYVYGPGDFHYGQFRAYRYTFENSRPGQGILAAWVNLCRLGRPGYAEYLVGLHAAREAATAALRRHDVFSVLNESSLGWEVVFAIHFAPDILSLARSYDEVAIHFMQVCWDRVNAGYDLPLFSIVPGYRINNNVDDITTAFLIYPMKQHSDEQWRQITALIVAQIRDFEARVRNGDMQTANVRIDKPIR